VHQTDFATDKEHSDDEVVWDDGEEDDDAGSNAAAKGSSTTHSDDGSEELEDSGEPLSHSSKFPGPSSIRDWSEDDDEPGSAIALGDVALHVAAAAATGAQAIRPWTCQHLRNKLLLLRNRPLQSQMTQREPEAGRQAPREGSSRLRLSRL
jgi:hypothetical protein